MLTQDQRDILKALGYVDHQIDRVTQAEFPLFLDDDDDDE